jgi:hypothetical protein
LGLLLAIPANESWMRGASPSIQAVKGRRPDVVTAEIPPNTALDSQFFAPLFHREKVA